VVGSWGRTYSADDERNAEPHFRAEHFVGVERCDEEEQYGESNGDGQIGDVGPEIDRAPVLLEFWHLGRYQIR
jgi:hypothetical protein